jgi:hypothetical protein
MGGCVIRTGDRQIVHKTRITQENLAEIARALGIPETVRDLIRDGGESIHIYAGTRVTRRARRPATSQPSGGRP